MKNIDLYSHVRGESIYIDDMPLVAGTLHIVILYSSIANGIILNIDDKDAKSIDGVHSIIYARDIPGVNQIGNIFPDEPLLANNEVHFIGNAIGLILAESPEIGIHARSCVKIEYEEKPAVFDPREAYEKDFLIQPPRTFENGDVDTIWDSCDLVIEDTVEIGGQEHLYLETQASYAIPQEAGKLLVHSSTQSPTLVQKIVARVLGLSMNFVEIDVKRMGGAFGGKEDQANAYACMAALGSYLSNKPAKIVLSRHDDMHLTGKRHPYSVDYKIGMTNNGKILGYDVTFYQDAGASADLSTAIIERTLFHAANAYYIPNLRALGISARTNFHPHTAFRGFGAPQAVFTIESAIHKLAGKSQFTYSQLQEINLMKDGDETHYGQIMENSTISTLWNKLDDKFSIRQKEIEIEEYNKTNSRYKKGVAAFPLCFGISFTKIMLNQAGALIHVYQDGSVAISTGGTEMGQGLQTRMVQVAATLFSISYEKIKIEATNTTRVANTSPSAASATADLNGKALENAANKIIKRLKTKAGLILNQPEDQIIIKNGIVGVMDSNGELDRDHKTLEWDELIIQSYLSRIDLSAHGFYQTPGIHFDSNIEKGHPFAYYSFGTCQTEVTLDTLRGTFIVDTVNVVHDVGKLMNRELDLGQLEGGIVQGLGWTLMEELKYLDDGRLASNTFSAYKIPDISFTPEMNIDMYEHDDNPMGIFRSKAIGEPPLFYGISALFALKNAISAFNPSNDSTYRLPLTPERALMDLYRSDNS